MIKLRKTLAVAALAILAAVPAFTLKMHAQQSDRAKQIGGKFMCMCNCNQVLTQCNHVGCTTSASMLAQLDQSLTRGESEESITQAFVQEFGTKVYAEPPKSGFSLIAWSLPTIYLVLGTMLVVFTISRMRKAPVTRTATAGGAGGGISSAALERARAQASRETQD